MVVFKAQGRLGNLMLEYAAALGCARKGEEICAVINEEVSRKPLVTNEFFKNVRVLNETPESAVLWRERIFPYVKIERKSDDVVFHGTFFSEKYFDIMAVRNAFAIPSGVKQTLEFKFGDWLSRSNVTGIHVRRGDYLTQQHLFPFVGKNYLSACIKRVPECSDFIVCSDDIPWCKKYFLKNYPGKRFLFSEINTPLEDMYLLSLCKNVICSNGSFAWWGGWLNPNPSKKVFAPSMWFGYCAARRVDWKDVYFDGMTIVKNRYDLRDALSAIRVDMSGRIRAMLTSVKLLKRIYMMLKKGRGQ